MNAKQLAPILALVAGFVAAVAWGSWQVRAAEAVIVEERARAELLREAVVRDSAVVATLRDSVLIVREQWQAATTDIEQERSAAAEAADSAAGLAAALAAGIAANASDSAAVVALVQDLRDAHQLQVHFLEAQIVAADSLTAVALLRADVAERALDAQGTQLAAVRAERDSWMRRAQAAETVAYPPVVLRLAREAGRALLWSAAGYALASR